MMMMKVAIDIDMDDDDNVWICFWGRVDDLYIIGAVCGSRKMITSSWEPPVIT